MMGHVSMHVFLPSQSATTSTRHVTSGLVPPVEYEAQPITQCYYPSGFQGLIVVIVIMLYNFYWRWYEWAANERRMSFSSVQLFFFFQF